MSATQSLPPPSIRDMPGDQTRILRDVDDGGVDLDVHAEFLIGRVPATGTLAQVDWLRQHYGDQRIGQTV